MATKGRGMQLIGHTDARGEVEYNLGLGQRRAGSVADYVGAHGVEKARIRTTSHGDANGFRTCRRETNTGRRRRRRTPATACASPRLPAVSSIHRFPTRPPGARYRASRS